MNLGQLKGLQNLPKRNNELMKNTSKKRTPENEKIYEN